MLSSSLLRRVRLTPAPISSSSTALASAIIVRPSSRSFFCPPERLPASSFFTCARPMKSMTSSARARTRSSSRRTRPRLNQAASRCSPAWSAGTTIRFSSADMRANSCGIWKVRSRPRAKRRWAGRRVTSRPSNRMAPPSAGQAPVTMLNRVVLPAPFGPMSPVTVPASTVRLHRSTAHSPPKRLIASRTSMIAGMLSPGCEDPNPDALIEVDPGPGLQRIDGDAGEDGLARIGVHVRKSPDFSG